MTIMIYAATGEDTTLVSMFLTSLFRNMGAKVVYSKGLSSQTATVTKPSPTEAFLRSKIRPQLQNKPVFVSQIQHNSE